ncbi:cobalt ECF transporter T component CbiQ [Parageobacillus thermoglucosidasius]|uniref:cobalt ECF transporter T component CbiQ n=1 Tax=Parageobacillus thermoglucosidasius TaxID=1426 RepID=UPI000F61F5B8|nr:cobalt ECF transporter T component CbiQ [Parageobacillus thermoglucosidasius]GCD82918.1 cobalt ECF transporter T component CbiQ [Parageobacillus thermoglucosidasius]
MSNMINSLSNMRLLDDLARKKTFIHRIHPLIKLLTTVAYLTVVVSFERHEISGLLPFIFYPILIFALAEIPVAPILKMILFIEPLIIGIGILNPLFDHSKILLGGIAISKGWFTFLSIFIKCSLTVTASILLIATTGMDRLAAALRMLKIPKIFVLQLLLTYRYISVLIEEVSRMMRAYSLRAPGQKGIKWSVWGSFAGQLLLRTFERAERVYQAMSLRGFTGEYHTGEIAKLSFKDLAYFAAWILFFVIARIYDIPVLLGSLFTGVMR